MATATRKTGQGKSRSGTSKRRLWYVPHRQIRTAAASRKARQVLEWATTGSGLDHEPDETELFVALHTCAYRAERRAVGATISARERNEWSRRWYKTRDYIVNRNVPLAYSMIGRFRSTGLDRDELLSEALFGLVQAVERFDPWRGFRFSTYACNAIQRAMIRSSRSADTYRRRFPVVHEDWHEEPELEDSQTELYVERLNQALHHNLGELTDLETRILAKRFPAETEQRMTLQQIGQLVGLSKERVRQLQDRALTKLREVLEADPVLQ